MPNISVLIKPASGMCNLQCKYCFYCDETKNREVESYGFMEEETLEKVIQKVLDFSDTACTIAYQGGEPFLRGLDFFKKSVELQKKYNIKGIKISNTIQTNGTCLDEDWAKFLKENNFLVGISLDGIMFTHDSFRVDKKGQGTFERVMEGIGLLKKYEVDFNILTVVNAATAKKITQIYDYFKQNGFMYLQFIPCLNPLGMETERFPHTLTPKAYGHFLKTLFDLWYNDFRKGVMVHIQQFEEYVRMLLLMQPDVCGMSGICSCQNVVEADGGVYPCDFYVLDEYKLGSLKQNSFEEIHEKRKEIHFVEDSAIMHEDCKKCKYAPICRGGCRRHRVIADCQSPKNYFCESYYEFFSYSISRLEEIAAIYQKNY
ncbi:anaerobic sulfatase maturase [Lachnospiraceae bacterium]|nr:anaerobic sulfatase maturase [Lachnospiraceae bacterium]